MTIECLLPGISLLPLNDRSGFGYCQFISHTDGNILLTRGKASLSDCFGWIEEQGGVEFVLISDRHFAGPGSVEVAERFSARMILSDIEAKAAAKRCPVPDPLPFKPASISSSIDALPTPGHTPGQFCYLISHNQERLLFTGDFVRWEFGKYLPGNNSRKKMRPGLESLCAYEFDKIIGCTCYGDGPGSFIEVANVKEEVAHMIEGCPRP